MEFSHGGIVVTVELETNAEAYKRVKCLPVRCSSKSQYTTITVGVINCCFNAYFIDLSTLCLHNI